MLESLFNKVAGLKETPTQVFSCKICEICKNTFFFTEQVLWLLLNKPRGSIHCVVKQFFGYLAQFYLGLSNIMFSLLLIFLDISLLFKLKYAATLLLSYCGLWISHVIMTYFVYINTQKWEKRQFFGVKKFK